MGTVQPRRGRTVRGMSERHQKRYAAQPVIVKRSITPQTATTKPESLRQAEAGYLFADVNDSLDDGHLACDSAVQYSLNKKGRWKLPELLKREIAPYCRGKTSGEQTADTESSYESRVSAVEDDYDVTILEYHKSHKSSPCIGAHSTKLDKEVKPKNTYMNPKSVPELGGNPPRRRNRRGQRGGHQDEEEEEETEVAEPKPEIVYEVYYPAKNTSESAHDPRFTMAGSYFDGYKPRKENAVSHRGKHRTTYRQSSIQREVDDYDAAQEDMVQMALDASLQDSLDATEQQKHSNQPIPDASDPSFVYSDGLVFGENISDFLLMACACEQLWACEDVIPPPPNEPETIEPEMQEENEEDVESDKYALASILEHAFSVKNMCDGVVDTRKQRRRHDSGRKQEKATQGYDYDSIRVDDTEPEEGSSQQNEETESSSLAAAAAPANLLPLPQIGSLRVFVQKDDITADNLRATYGERIHVSQTLPTKYVLDITNEVLDGLMDMKLEGVITGRLDLITYLVLEPTAVDDGSLDHIPVRIHLASVGDLDQVPLLVDGLLQYTLPELVTEVINFITSREISIFKQKDALFLRSDKSLSHKFSLINTAFKQEYACLPPEVAANMIMAKNQPKWTDEMKTTQSSYDFADIQIGIYCDICFDLISFDEHKYPAAMALVSCQHWFCNSCWQHHLMTDINRGVTKIHCPAHKCETVLDSTSILALVGPKYVRRHLLAIQNATVGNAVGTMWCPNPACGRIILVGQHVDKPTRMSHVTSLTCDCGFLLCSRCHGQAHFPLSCEQAKEYTALLKQRGEYNVGPRAEGTDFVVNVRRCPKCQEPVDKNGGCNYMTCRCGQGFCWTCGKKYEGASHASCYNNMNTTATRQKLLRMVLGNETNSKRRGKQALKTFYYNEAVSHRRKYSGRAIDKYRKNAMELAIKIKSLNLQCSDVPNPLLSALKHRSASGTSLDSLEGAAGSSAHQEALTARSERQQITDYMLSIVDLLAQLHHLAEHVTLLMEDKRYWTLKPWLVNVEFICSQLHVMLDAQESVKPEEVIKKVEYFTRKGQDYVNSLIGMLASPRLRDPSQKSATAEEVEGETSDPETLAEEV